MEIIRIENGSYKISLDENEAREYEIASEDESPSCEINSSIKKLLEKLKEKREIDIGDGKTTIEIYISKDGGCEIFVSRARLNTPIAKSKPLSKLVYRFEKLRELLCACVGLRKSEYDGEGSIYYNESCKSYYLFLSGIHQKDIRYSFLCEYGSKIKSSLYPYIFEHCRCICENNAIEIFSKLL